MNRGKVKREKFHQKRIILGFLLNQKKQKYFKKLSRIPVGRGNCTPLLSQRVNPGIYNMQNISVGGGWPLGKNEKLRAKETNEKGESKTDEKYI